MSANPVANGGLLRRPLDMSDFRDCAVNVEKPGATLAGNVPTLGNFLREVTRLNMQNFRVFGPDETQSNRLQALYDVTKKVWLAEYFPEDTDGGELAPHGRVMEMLSEHTVEGWLEGYLLSGRHGLINSYEPFIHVIDSMFNQHAKWLEKCNELPWRAKISSLNLLITALVWRQDHNGFTHQDPGFLDVVANKSPSVVRIYLPPDANCLLSVADHCLRSVNYINVIVADKQVHLQYLDIEAAIEHCTKGAGIWDWASNDHGGEPDVVMASCGDCPTIQPNLVTGDGSRLSCGVADYGQYSILDSTRYRRGSRRLMLTMGLPRLRYSPILFLTMIGIHDQFPPNRTLGLIVLGVVLWW